MKKILCILSSILLSASIAFAQDELSNIADIINNTTMPTDEEIMETIEKFNFTKEQQQQLFKETKKQLEQIYKDGNADSFIQSQTALPEVQKTDRNLNIEPPKLKDRPKKYSNHPPLTR